MCRRKLGLKNINTIRGSHRICNNLLQVIHKHHQSHWFHDSSETPVPGSRRDSESLVDVESEEIVLESTKPVPRRPKKKNAGKKKKKGMESDTEMLEDQPPRKQHNPLSQEVQRPSKITSTKMSAEQMMKERNALNEQRGWPKFEN